MTVIHGQTGTRSRAAVTSPAHKQQPSSPGVLTHRPSRTVSIGCRAGKVDTLTVHRTRQSRQPQPNPTPGRRQLTNEPAAMFMTMHPPPVMIFRQPHSILTRRSGRGR